MWPTPLYFSSKSLKYSQSVQPPIDSFRTLIINEDNRFKQFWNRRVFKTYLWITMQDSPEKLFEMPDFFQVKPHYTRAKDVANGKIDSQTLYLHRMPDSIYCPTGNRFLDYMGFQSGYFSVGDIIHVDDLTLTHRNQENIDRNLFRPETSLFQFFVR